MLDDNYFEDFQELAENNAYLKALEERLVCLDMLHQLPAYEELKDLEERLRKEGALQFESILKEPTGYYTMKCFLIADYAVDKALFVRDVDAYKKMRFETARQKIAKLLYDRFVSPEEHSYEKGISVFEIVRKQDKERKERKSKKRSHRTFGIEKNPDGSTTSAPSSSNPSSVFRIGQVNPIGVYGRSVQRVKNIVLQGSAPTDLFDEIYREVINDLKLDVFPRFKQSDFYKKYIRTKWIETASVSIKDFACLRVLGRGGFGVVHACRKTNSGAIYAMKCMSKRLIRQKRALKNVLEERNVLTMMNSKFVTNLKYALQDEEKLYLILDLMLGGDLKYHLLQGRFKETRARFYAAQILLGLEHIHSCGVIYRDMKLENVLLDSDGHCHITDLGLAALPRPPKSDIKGYAGTPGYTAPEMIEGKPYGPAVDIFSLGVLTYRMLMAEKPFTGSAREIDNAVRKRKPKFPREFFSPEAKSLLEGLLVKKPEHRLGCDSKVGIQAIKDHPFFASIDWGLLEAGYLDPPFSPDQKSVNAAALKDIGLFDHNKYKNIKLVDRFKQSCQNFEFVSKTALQEEMVAVLEKDDENVNFERFAVQTESESAQRENGGKCCVIL